MNASKTNHRPLQDLSGGKITPRPVEDTKLTLCEHIEIKGGHCVACMEEGKLAFAKVSSNYSVGYKDGRASAIKEFKKFLDKYLKEANKRVNIFDLDSGIHKGHWTYDDILLEKAKLLQELKKEFEKELGGTQ